MHEDNMGQKIPADSNFLVTNTELPGEGLGDGLDLQDVASEVTRLFRDYSQVRQDLEDDWLDCWAHYFGNVRSQTHLRQAAARIVGDVNDDWRHRISTSKAYENIETICGYFQSAFFPNKEWFSLTPTEPGYVELVKPVERYLQQKLEAARFSSVWDMFIRQAVILGTSAIALPWRVETAKHKKRVMVKTPVFGQFGEIIDEQQRFEIKEEDRLIHNGPDFEVLDMFDFFLDPMATDPNNANVIRRMRKTKAEVLHLIEDGYYPYGSKYSIITCKGTSTPDVSESHKDTVKMFAGLEYRPNEQIEILEFWGDIQLPGKTYHNVVVTITGGKVLRFELNPYWYGKPFMVATYVPVNRSVYGVGALQPTLGLLHEMNILTNQRLDNLELGVDQMWTMIPDGTLRKEDIFTKPGQVFEVSDHNALQPVERADIGKLTITYEESSFLETRIDKATGTGAFISAGAGRSGERVTATEVQAQRDAGGNRLASRHQHLEEAVLIPTLSKLYIGCQQFTEHDEVVRLPSPQPGAHLYAQVGPNELVHNFRFNAQGATHIADKEFELRKWLDFLQTVGTSPQMAPQINWSLLLEKLVGKFGLDDAEALILPPAPPPQPMMPEAPPPDPLQEELMGMGGQAMVDMFKGEQMAGTMPGTLANLFNEKMLNGQGDPNNPALQAGIQQMMQQQGLG
jgi:hypothetical protein